MTNSHQGAVERLTALLANATPSTVWGAKGFQADLSEDGPGQIPMVCAHANGVGSYPVAWFYRQEDADLWCAAINALPAILTACQAAEARNKELEAALRSLTFAARTSGGTAGPDAGLMHACDDAEALLLPTTGGEGA